MNNHQNKPISDNILNWLQKSLGEANKIISIDELEGATSASIHLISTINDNVCKKFVLRVFTDSNVLAEEPDLPYHDATILRKVHKAKLPSPQLIAYSQDKTQCELPVVLMSYIEGCVNIVPKDFDVWLKQLAEALVDIHTATIQNLDWEYTSWVNKNNLITPSWSNCPQLWQKAFDIYHQEMPDFKQVFLHRDFHPTNILWKSDKINGIVDWVNGCYGPVGVDVAHCRNNLLLMYGMEIADKFLKLYSDLIGGYEHHPYWDIDAILIWFPEPEYYPPWECFNLGKISQATLNHRFDEYIKAIMRRI